MDSGATIIIVILIAIAALITQHLLLRKKTNATEKENNSLKEEIGEYKGKLKAKEEQESKRENIEQELNESKVKCSVLEAEKKAMEENLHAEKTKAGNLEKIQGELRTELASAQKKYTTLETTEEERKQTYEKRIEILNNTQERLEQEREQEKKDAHKKELDRLEALKDTWKNHENKTKQTIKLICEEHTIPYVDNFPFKGKPDNAIQIADEYIIFDAKSPGSDDLRNFPNYIKAQAEQAKKYAKQETVKRWIFLVVPSNTHEVLTNYIHKFPDYEVFVVTLDSLTPIILCLKKIEEYEFANQLSPEDREKICSIVGKFVHLSKRRIQIDSFFIGQFLELMSSTENNLPEEILEEVKKIEKTGKINPPLAKGKKEILIDNLSDTFKSKSNDAIHQGILIDQETVLKQINEIPLSERTSI